jgi:hypothetical protein
MQQSLARKGVNMIKQLYNSVPEKIRFVLELIGGTILAGGFLASVYLFCIMLCAINDKCYYYYFPGVN